MKSLRESDLIFDKIEAGIKEGSALIVRDIAENMRKFGISPVIAIDGKLKNLRPKTIECETIKNLEKFLKKENHDAEDFLFFESKNSKYSKDKTKLISGFIICIYKASGKVREYKSSDTSWVETFISDLKNKFFN